MSIRLPGGLATLGALSLALGAAPASGQPEEPEIPKAFRDCVGAFRQASARPEVPPKPFRCTESYAEAIPTGLGGTLQELQAKSRAIEAAERYIERELVPLFEERLKKDVDSRGDYILAKARMLAMAVSSARLYDQALCDFVDEAVGAGTYRRIAAADCQIRNRDRLIDDLLWSWDVVTQGLD